VGDPHWSGLFLKNCTPWEGPTLGQFVNCLPWEGTHAGAGEESEEEGAAEALCDELTITPISLSPCAAHGEEAENLGVELSPGRREGWGEGVLRFSFYFSLPYSDLIGNKSK